MLIKSCQNDMLKSVTDWLLPVLVITDINDYFNDVCVFMKR